MLLRPSYLADVGLFDEHLFLYYEDTDLSWRGRALGWHYRIEPTSVVRHLHAASTGETSPVFRYYNERNRLVVLVKNAPAALARRAARAPPPVDPVVPAPRPRRGAWRIVAVPTWPWWRCGSGPTGGSCGSSRGAAGPPAPEPAPDRARGRRQRLDRAVLA